jgi:2-polyprenyl-3-methyl-5-hydroxy-6-metoxy-1,4-benzoquinol methylase
MNKISSLLKSYHTEVFSRHGATAKGVDWGDEAELVHRYDKMLRVLDMDFYTGPEVPSLLDVGCGWGGLAARIRELGVKVEYHGLDVVDDMVEHGRSSYPEAVFSAGDILELGGEEQYDFLICNGILTQKHDFTIPEMERYAKDVISRMFALSRHGIAFNMMSTRVNFAVGNLYYQNPVELFTWLLNEVSPRVVLDHGYSSLASGRGKFYDFTAYVYKH